MEKKQVNEQRMFEVFEAIHSNDLNNNQYCLYTTGLQDEIYTDTVFGTKDKCLLHTCCRFIVIWMSEDGVRVLDENDFPQPDFKLVGSEEFGSDTLLFYEFPFVGCDESSK